MATDGPTNDRSRWVALVVLCVGMLMMILDQTVVNVALPSIERDLGFTQSSLAWVVNAYLIAFGGLLLLAGRLGDLVGRKRVFVAGLTVFTTASLLCGLSRSRGMLVGARFLQGIGGALTSSVILGMIVTLFPEPREQAKAIGVFSFTASAGGAIGLLAGGLLTQALSWHWIFFVNVPVGVVATVAAVRVLRPQAGAGLRQGADVGGAVLVTGGLMLLVYTIVETTDRGWTAGSTLATGTVALALLVAFVVRQSRARQPLLPLRIFRSRTVSVANSVHAVVMAAMFGYFFLAALYLQRVLGFDAAQTGLAFLPMTVAIAAMALGMSARLTMRFGAHRVLLPGVVLMSCGLALLSRAPVDGRYVVDVLPVMLVLGIGAGLCVPSLMLLAMSAAAPSESGLASGLINTAEQVGGALGLAVLATLSTSRTDALLARGRDPLDALTAGYHRSFVVGAALLLVAAGLAAAGLRSPTVGSDGDADRAADRRAPARDAPDHGAGPRPEGVPA
jgi:EmrB/QacA subfamily drug resistance transporter